MSCIGSYIIPVKAYRRPPVPPVLPDLAPHGMPEGPGAGTSIWIPVCVIIGKFNILSVYVTPIETLVVTEFDPL